MSITKFSLYLSCIQKIPDTNISARHYTRASAASETAVQDSCSKKAIASFCHSVQQRYRGNDNQSKKLARTDAKVIHVNHVFLMNVALFCDLVASDYATTQLFIFQVQQIL